MEIGNDHLFDFMQDVKQSLGRIEAKVDNHQSYIAAVSHKADMIREEQRHHVENNDAHGLVAARNTAKTFYTIMTILVALVGVAINVTAKLWSK